MSADFAPVASLRHGKGVRGKRQLRALRRRIESERRRPQRFKEEWQPRRKGSGGRFDSSHDA